MNTRESYRVLPAWTNGFWTWLTGAALEGDRPARPLTPWSFLLLAAASYAGGIAFAIAGAAASAPWGWIAVACGWFLTVSGARRLVSTVVHQCIHSRFSGRRGLDRFVGELITVLTLTQTAAAYRREHFEQHHRLGIFSTKHDPAVRFLVGLGFRPGRSIPALWGQLFLNTVSPLFHVRFFVQRCASNFVEASAWRLAAAYAYLLAWWAPVALGWLDPTSVLVGAGVPMLFLYQISVMLEFVSEHAWLVPTPPVAHAHEVHRTHSWARFCGAATPDRLRTQSSLSYFGQWVGWTVAHACYHLPVRVLVLPGDLPQHDFHHRQPATTEWPQAAHARQRYMRTEAEQALEFWGLHRAITHVFQGLRDAPRSEAPARPLNTPRRGDTEV